MITVKDIKTPAEKLAWEVANRARNLIPMHIWAHWPLYSMDKWHEDVYNTVLSQLKAKNFREAGR